jgi:hypothetical protein
LDLRVSRAIQEPRVLTAQLDHKDLRVYKVLLVLMELKDLKVFKVRLDLRALLEQTVQLDLRDLKVFRDLLVLMVRALTSQRFTRLLLP